MVAAVGLVKLRRNMAPVRLLSDSLSLSSGDIESCGTVGESLRVRA